MAQTKKSDRVLGPYIRRDKFRLVLIGGDDGRRSYKDFPSQAKALAWKAKLLESLALTAGTTVGQAIELYEKALVTKGNKPGPIHDTIWRLGRLFTDKDALLASITPADGKKLYQTLQDYRSKRLPDGYAPDSHRNMLLESRTFLRWCVAEKLAKVNALEGVAGVGKRKPGAQKDQLRIDEARRWTKAAMQAASEGEEGAVAALMTMILGVRCSEATSRIVRDLDDGGRLLWIPDTKTEAGRRTIEVPKKLQPLLRRLARGKGPNDYLLGDGNRRRDRNFPSKWCKKLCRLAGVPVVGGHAMRRLHSTLAVTAGATGHLVAASLGHESFKTTEHSYVKSGTMDALRRRQGMDVLDGKRRPPPTPVN